MVKIGIALLWIEGGWGLVWIGLERDWVGLGWVGFGLGWVRNWIGFGLGWVGLGSIGLDGVGLGLGSDCSDCDVFGLVCIGSVAQLLGYSVVLVCSIAV